MLGKTSKKKVDFTASIIYTKARYSEEIKVSKKVDKALII